MRLVYFTALEYPSEMANNSQVRAMASAFSRALGGDFILVMNKGSGALRTEGIDVREIGCPWKRGRTVYNFFWFARRAGKLFKPGEVNVVYVKDPQLGIIAALLKPFFGYAICFESHLLFSPWKDRLICRRSDAVIALTSLLRDDLASARGCDAGKIAVCPDAVDLNAYAIKISRDQARGKLSLPADRKVAVYAGSFQDWKGTDILIGAAGRLPENYLAVLVGLKSGDRRNPELSRIPANVRVVERQAASVVALYYAAADVLVLPNKRGNANSERYTSPLKLFEYMAARRPIVASDLPSIREIINESNGILVGPGDPAGLAAGITRAAEDAFLARSLADRAWAAVQDHTWDKRAGKILEFIGSRMAARPRT